MYSRVIKSPGVIAGTVATGRWVRGSSVWARAAAGAHSASSNRRQRCMRISEREDGTTAALRGDAQGALVWLQTDGSARTARAIRSTIGATAAGVRVGPPRRSTGSHAV